MTSTAFATADSALSDAFGRLDTAISDVSQVLGFVADPETLGSVVGDVVLVQNRFDALMAQYAGQLDASGAPKRAGMRSVGQLVAAQTNASPAPIRAASGRARWLCDFPVFEQAFASGGLTGAHLDFLRRKVHCGRTHATLRGEQEFFVESAQNCSFADFKKVGEYWLIAVDPDGDEPEVQRKRTSLSLRVGQGGRVLINGEFDALTGQALRTAVDRDAQQLSIIDKDNGIQRSEGERRAEALINLVTKGAARADGTHPAPLINIVMSETVAEYLLEEAAIETGEPAPVKWNDVDGRCELIDGTPIHPKHVLPILGVATFRRHILNAKGRVIDVSVNARSFPQWMRNALHVQARGACETHGCDAPHRWIHADHTDPHSHGGPTRLSNGQNQCGADNLAKTNTTGNTAWRDRRRPDRREPARRQLPRRDTHRPDKDDDPDSDHHATG